MKRTASLWLPLLLLLAGCPEGVPLAQSTPAPAPKPTPTPTIVFQGEDGQTLTQNDLAGAVGTVRWEIHAGTAPPAKADQLHRQAREAGKAGDLNEALRLFAEAHAAAPEWAYPIYDTAWTHLLNGDRDKAIANYRKVDALCPRGFFTTKAALDSLRREKEGLIGEGLYRAVVSLEWEKNVDSKRETLQAVVQRFPKFPVAWLTLAHLLEGEERLGAIRSGLSHNPDPDTKGLLLINRATLFAKVGDRASAVKILGSLALDADSTLSTAEMAKWTLANLPEAETPSESPPKTEPQK